MGQHVLPCCAIAACYVTCVASNTISRQNACIEVLKSSPGKHAEISKKLLTDSLGRSEAFVPSHWQSEKMEM